MKNHSPDGPLPPITTTAKASVVMFTSSSHLLIPYILSPVNIFFLLINLPTVLLSPTSIPSPIKLFLLPLPSSNLSSLPFSPHLSTSNLTSPPFPPPYLSPLYCQFILHGFGIRELGQVPGQVSAKPYENNATNQPPNQIILPMDSKTIAAL